MLNKLVKIEITGKKRSDRLFKECEAFFSGIDAKTNKLANKLNFKYDFIISGIDLISSVEEQLTEAQDRIVTNVKKQIKTAASNLSRGKSNVSILKFIPSKKATSQNVIKYLFDQMTGQVTCFQYKIMGHILIHFFSKGWFLSEIEIFQYIWVDKRAKDPEMSTTHWHHKHAEFPQMSEDHTIREQGVFPHWIPAETLRHADKNHRQRLHSTDIWRSTSRSLWTIPILRLAKFMIFVLLPATLI